MLGVQWECAQRGTRTRTSGGKQGCESTSTIARLFFFFSRLPRERALTASNSTRRERERERREERASGRGRVGSLGRHLFFLFFFPDRHTLSPHFRQEIQLTTHASSRARRCMRAFFLCLFAFTALPESASLHTAARLCSYLGEGCTLFSWPSFTFLRAFELSRRSLSARELSLSLSLSLLSSPRELGDGDGDGDGDGGSAAPLLSLALSHSSPVCAKQNSRSS